MERFFFNLYDDMIVIDEEGTELPSLEAARERARTNALHMACAEVMEGHLSLKHRIEVVDQTGATVATVHFRDVVEVERN